VTLFVHTLYVCDLFGVILIVVETIVQTDGVLQLDLFPTYRLHIRSLTCYKAPALVSAPLHLVGSTAIESPERWSARFDLPHQEGTLYLFHDCYRIRWNRDAICAEVR